MFVFYVLFLVIFLAIFKSWWSKQVWESFEGKRIFITGCDSGFGALMALRYSSEGSHVFASCLTESGARSLQEQASGKGKITTVLLDVVHDEQVMTAAEQVRRELEVTGSKLDAIINNAGIFLSYLVELTTVEEYKRNIDVNFIGCVRVVKAFLPLIKQPGGRVIGITSIADSCPGKGFSAYAVSKHAQRAFLEVLRYELQHCGIKVIRIAPGFYRTPLLQTPEMTETVGDRYERASENIRSRYSQRMISSDERFAKYVHWVAGDPKDVVETVRRAALQKYPSLSTTVGYDAYFLQKLDTFSPLFLKNLFNHPDISHWFLPRPTHPSRTGSKNE